MKDSEIFISPLFADALSGEFTTPNDKELKRQTLGKLAFEVCGGISNPMGETHFRLKPSWAPESGASVTLVENQIVKLILTDHSYKNLIAWIDLSSHSSQGGELLEISKSNGEVHVEKLESGPSLTTLREEIAKMAQEFYDEYSD